MRSLLAAAALLTAGCVPHPDSTPPPPESGECNAAPAQGLIGRSNTPALVERARRLSGARTVRVLYPDDIATMEFRADRLNVHVHHHGSVVQIVCG